MEGTTCPKCRGPLDARTAGMTGDGLVCQRCVLRELDADRQQQESNEWRIEQRRRPTVTGMLVSGVVFTSRELSREDLWLDAETLAIPMFGRGVELWHVGADALITATVDKERCTPANEATLATPSKWSAIARTHHRRAWSDLTEVEVEDGLPSLRFGKDRVLAPVGQRPRLDALLTPKWKDWRKTERPMSAFEALTTPGCGFLLAAAVLGPLFALTSWLGSWDWDALFADLDAHGPRRHGGQMRLLLWLGWLVGAGGTWLTGGLLALATLFFVAMAISRVVKRPIVTTFTRPSPAP